MKDYLTIREVSELWGVTPRRIQKMCADGMIPGVERFGRNWAIPKDAEKPKDGRIVTGAYVGWRNNSK